MSQDQIAKLMAISGRQDNSAGEAPSLSDDGGDDAPPISAGHELSVGFDATPPALSPPPLDAAPRRVARRRPAGPVRGKIAANDDIPSIGGLIYALEQKPSTKIFKYAGIASALWAIAGLAFGALALAQDVTDQTTLTSLLLHPATFLTAAGVLGPIAIFWLLALLNWHIASLALKSSTMTEVAIRLAEPDRTAEQSIASLGQAVRRQVSFMNDAVSRALGRAGELEALVHNQVADLERSYEQNERRIRDLIEELSGERHALLNTSTSVTDTLKSLGTEIPMLIEKLSTQQVTLAGIIRGAGDNLTMLEGSLGNATGRFEHVLGERTQHLQTVLEDYTVAFSSALGARTEQMRTAFDGYMHTLDSTLGARTENLQTVFEEYGRALDTTLANRAQALDSQLIERTRSLDAAFQQRLEHFDAQIVRSTTAIDSAVSEKALLLTSALETHAVTFRETISRQAVDLDESVMNGINAVRRTSENITRQTMKAIDGLSQQSAMLQGVSENLFTQIHGVTDRFETQGAQILRAASTLDDANRRIDTTIQARHADLGRTIERLSDRTDEVGRTLAGYYANLEGSMTSIERRARELTSEIHDGATTRGQSLLVELESMKSQTAAEGERSFSELRSRLENVSGDLTEQFEQLSARIVNATDETRVRAAQAAAELQREQTRIRDEAARLPEVTRQSADGMRRALQDQMRALEHLTQIATKTTLENDVSFPEPATPAPRLAPPASRPDAARIAQIQPAAALPPRARAGDPRDNWKLGDLLARASHDDDALSDAPARAPMPDAARQPFRLDIAVIARALDAATASTVWSRIRAGQRNALVRSIYAPDARAVFDAVTSRLPTDPELAQTVARYLGDFQRIIDDADARDPTGRLTQSHLLSDTGRVYLFLAHAAGRFG